MVDSDARQLYPDFCTTRKPEQKTIREDALRKVAVLVEAVSASRPSPIDLTIPGKILRFVM